jgi:hypothetical protein
MVSVAIGVARTACIVVMHGSVRRKVGDATVADPSERLLLPLLSSTREPGRPVIEENADRDQRGCQECAPDHPAAPAWASWDNWVPIAATPRNSGIG